MRPEQAVRHSLQARRALAAIVAGLGLVLIAFVFNAAPLFVPGVALVFIVIWAVFWLYWIVAAFSMRRGRVPWSRELGVRVTIAAIVWLLVRVGALHGPGSKPDAWRVGLGLIFLGAGLGVAVWARRHIGRNWGMPMTRGNQSELVTAGAYRLVRHPIYSGLLLAVGGTAVAFSVTWLIGAFLAAVYFVYSAKVEEHYLAEQFPDGYPAYQRSTKMLMPHIF